MFYHTPRLPQAILHPLVAYDKVSVPGPAGQSRPVTKAVSAFMGVVMPLSNKDWELLPEGSYTQNSQKLYTYTDGPVSLKPGQTLRDTYDGQQYTVKTELAHNAIHPMLRYIVEGVVDK